MSVSSNVLSFNERIRETARERLVSRLNLLFSLCETAEGEVIKDAYAETLHRPQHERAPSPMGDEALVYLGRMLAKAYSNETNCQELVEQRRKANRSYQSASAEWQTAHDVCSAIVDIIEAIPTNSMTGLRVKALAIQWCHGNEPVDLCWQDTTDNRLATSIVHALLAQPEMKGTQTNG